VYIGKGYDTNMRRHRASGLPPQRNSIVYMMFAVALVGAVVGAVNVVGLGGTHAFSLYLASLLLGLVSTGLLFLLVAIHVFSSE
jgi:hypothetical protein